MSLKSMAEVHALEKELKDKGYAHLQIPGLVQPQYGFYRKPNGEIVRLPIGEDRLAFYNAKGFVYLAPEGVTTLEELKKKQQDELEAPKEKAKPKPRRKIKHRKTKERRKTQ